MRASLFLGLLALALLAAPAVEAIPITHQVTVQPVRVCAGDGSVCANPNHELFEAEADAIWAQAGIDIDFLPFANDVENDVLLNIFPTEFPTGSDAWFNNEYATLVDNLSGFDADGNPIFDPFFNGMEQDPGEMVLTMWFVGSLVLVPELGGPQSSFVTNLFGFAGNGQDARDIVITNPVFTTDRIDVLAHEIGHTLGLTHFVDNADSGADLPADNLMAPGSSRSIPDDLSDIGLVDLLNAQQIGIALSSPFVKPLAAVPVPATTLLLAVGLMALLGCKRGRAGGRREW